MSKTIILIFLMLSALIFPSYGNESKARQMKIGYTQGDFCLSLGTERRMFIQGAIQFPASDMARLKGNKIVKVRVGIGATLTEQQNSIFITNKLDGQPLYTQTVPELNAGWNEIELNIPFEITGEELFIGYSYVTKGMTVSLDASENNPLADWVATAEFEKDLDWYHLENCGSLNIQAIVEGDNLPQNDAAIFSSTSKKYAQTDHGYPLNLLVRNMGAADINNLDITYTLDGFEPVAITVDKLCIKSNDIASVIVDSVLIPEDGIYDLQVSIDKVNGTVDEFASGNQYFLENIVCKNEYVRRKVLLEQFSTSACNNCPNAHRLFEKNLRFRKDDVIWLIHHTGFYTDDLTIEESKKYVYFYNSPQHYAPAAMLDRTNLAQYGAVDQDYRNTPGPVFNTSSELIPRLLDQRVNSPALISVRIDKHFDLNNRLLTVFVSGEIPSGDIERLKGNDIRLNVYLVEDSIPGKQSGIEGTYIHNHAIRKVMTTVWGDELSFDDGNYLSKEYAFSIPPEWKEKNIRIIAFIANCDSGNPNNAQIFNAEETNLLSDPGEVAVRPIPTDSSIKVYLYEGKLFIKGDYQSAFIYNSTGSISKRILKPSNVLSIVNLEKGVYFIKFELNNTTIVRKFMKH